MPSSWEKVLFRLRRRIYGRKPPLVLINGLAEQAESWFKNHRFWSRYFDVHAPNILAYEGDALHGRIEAKLPVTVDYLVEELHTFLTRFVQRPPYHLVASSLGGKVAVSFSHRYPEMVNRMVLICPSGMGDEEKLPFMEGVRHNDTKAVVGGVFYSRRAADPDMMLYYMKRFPDRRWRTGLLRTVRGTMETTVRRLLPEIKHKTLLIAAEDDKIVDPHTAAEAAREMPDCVFKMIPRCGHAPQIEKSWLVNRLVAYFLSVPEPKTHPGFHHLLFTKRKKSVS